MNTKICSNPECREEKPATTEFFFKDKNRKSGLAPYCKVCHKKKRRKHYLKNKDKILKQNKKWKENNLEQDKETRKKHYEKNKESILVRQTVYKRNRRRVDPKMRIRENLSRRINDALKGNSKSASTVQLLGCSVEELKIHLEDRFTDGMSWDNYGVYVKGEPMKWHIDHIIPCDSFDLTNETEQAECFHYSNLQPMWGIDNIRKSNACSK